MIGCRNDLAGRRRIAATTCPECRCAPQSPSPQSRKVVNSHRITLLLVEATHLPFGQVTYQ